MLQLVRGLSSALLIAFISLVGRAILDKFLALKGGPPLVAEWAQVLSLTELFIGPIGAGVGLGLTALISRTDCHIHRQDILQEAWRAFRYALGLSMLCVLLIGIFYAWQVENRAHLWLIMMGATVAGVAGAYLTLINAWWTGKEQRSYLMAYHLLQVLVITSIAWSSNADHLIIYLIAAQAILALLLSTCLPKKINAKQASSTTDENRRLIDSYLLAGMVIGLMSPLSLLVIRYALDSQYQTGLAGIIQSIWRISEWVATPAATILAIYFLPQLSKAHQNPLLTQQLIRQAAKLLLGFSSIAYIIIYGYQTELFELFYDSNFVPHRHLLLYFLLGDWLRIASWIFLFSFYGRGAIRPIVIGEFLSLPLLAILITWAPISSEHAVGIFYLMTYICYLIYNLWMHWGLCAPSKQSS